MSMPSTRMRELIYLRETISMGHFLVREANKKQKRQRKKETRDLFQKEGFQNSEFEPECRVAKIYISSQLRVFGFKTCVKSEFNEL